jgi:hypothetical protein
MEMKAVLSNKKTPSSVMGHGVRNDWAGPAHRCALSRGALTQSSDLRAENQTRQELVLLTDEAHDFIETAR